MSKLTKKSVDDTNALPKPYLLWDGELRGFGLQVLPSGVKTYILQYRNGARSSRRLTTGRHGVLTVGEAVVNDVRSGAQILQPARTTEAGNCHGEVTLPPRLQPCRVEVYARHAGLPRTSGHWTSAIGLAWHSHFAHLAAHPPTPLSGA